MPFIPVIPIPGWTIDVAEKGLEIGSEIAEDIKEDKIAKEQQKAINEKYFNEDGYLEIPDEVSVAMMDLLIKADDLRKTAPLDKRDNIAYPHRTLYTHGSYHLTIGDSSFVIPPQAISIMSESTSQQMVTLRQENTQKIKNGYSKRVINVELVFHGYNQINGYKVESPEGYYYVDGLRQLLAQFKCTPFLPIKNRTINITYNIHAVALQSIICSTVEGFPDMMIANLTLQEVDLYPYLESNTMFFDTFIDWDLFRFYYQRQLTETHEYGKLQSIPINKELNKFKMSILDEIVFSTNVDYKTGFEQEINYDTDYITYYDEKFNLKGEKSSYTFYDIVLDRKVVYSDDSGTIHVESPSEKRSSNFIECLNSETDNFHIKSFQCGYSNILTNIQMAENSHPTIQYMGGMDTMFNITIETTSESVVQTLEECNIRNNELTRNNKNCSSLGFIKLESELTELFGSKFVIVDNVTTHTVPDFPGLFICQINCVSFDIYQKEREGILGLSPFKKSKDEFNSKGTKENAIKQTLKGLKEKIRQDLCIESKIRKVVELYPDLKLPTYKEVDEVIKKIIAFRKTHTLKDGTPLSSYPIDRYPRTPQCMLHGIAESSKINIDDNGFVTNIADVLEDGEKYQGFVDPDFYMFYHDTYKGLMDAVKDSEDIEQYTNPVPEAKTITGVTTQYANDITTDSDISHYDEELATFGATEAQMAFIALARKKASFVMANTDKEYRYTNNNDPNKGNLRVGPNAYDCSGFVGACLYEMGVLSSPYITTTSVENLIKSGILKEKAKINNTANTQMLITLAKPGDLLHVYAKERGKDMGHIAIYTGNGNHIHAISGGPIEEPVKNWYYRLLEVPVLAKTSNTTQIIKTGDNTTNTTSAKVTKKNGSEAEYISNAEIESIARVIANIQLGKPTEVQEALAQLIYDRFTIEDARYGTLNTILTSSIFNGSYAGTVPESIIHAVKQVFCKGRRKSEKQLVYYMGPETGYTTEENLDSQFTRDYENGDFVFWTNSKPTSTKRYTLLETNAEEQGQTLSRNSIETTKEYSLGVSPFYENLVKLFGKPVLVRTDDMNNDKGWIKGLADGTGLQNQEERYRNTYNTAIQKLTTAFVNQCEYSGKGRLVKAFPTYLFCIVDEDGNWLDGKKLWGNYYILRSLVDIQVVSYNDSPVSTATITVTNSYGNLDTLPPNAFYYSPSTDTEYNAVNRWLYDTFGMLIGTGPKLTQTLVDQKNIIYNSMIIRPGCRMHLRMGYGSDPLSLPVVMNGYISDLQLGDITQFVCVSDGVELVNSVVSDNPKDVNGIFEHQEASNLCIDVLTARQSWLNKLNMQWGEPNKFGIEHFGLYFTEHINLQMLIDEYLDSDNMTIDITINDEVVSIPITKDMVNDIEGIINGTIETELQKNLTESYEDNSWLQGVIDSWKNAEPLGPELPQQAAAGFVQALGYALEWLAKDDGVDKITNAVITTELNIFGITLTLGKNLLDGLFKSLKEIQYDLIKNIYRTSYKGSLATYTPFWGMFDDEKNICFNKYNKTPWDVIQMGVMNAPEYIGMPLYHQFESRLFLGLPWYLVKYRYNVINGEVFEEAKTFAQCHFIDSLTDIIDNQMLTTSQDVYTNAIVMYTRGKSPVASPTLYSDKTISFSMQSTKIFDSSVTQNFIGPDALWELIGIQQGKDGAIRVGTSQLLWNWQKAYQGDIILLGDAGINPNDYLYVNDRYNELTGLCTARTVIQSLSVRTGFTTTVTPGMIGMATDNMEDDVTVNTIPNLTNMVIVGSAFSHYASVKKTVKENAEKVASWYNEMMSVLDTLTVVQNVGAVILVAGGAHKIIHSFKAAGGVANLLQQGKNIIQLTKRITNIYKYYDTLQDAKKFGTIVKTAKHVFKAGATSLKLIFAKGGTAAGTAAAPGVGSAIGFVVGFTVGLLLDILLAAVIDFLSYNNVVALLPMMHKNMPYAPILNGEKLLLTGSSNTSNDSIADKVTGAPQKEGDLGEESHVSSESLEYYEKLKS